MSQKDTSYTHTYCHVTGHTDQLSKEHSEANTSESFVFINTVNMHVGLRNNSFGISH